MSTFRPGERVVTPYGLGRAVAPRPVLPRHVAVQVDGRPLETYFAAQLVRPLYYPQQLAPGARKDNPSYAAAIADEVKGEANPYLEAQK